MKPVEIISMMEDKILTGENVSENFSGAFMAGDGGPKEAVKKEEVVGSLKDRISKSTEAGGLKELPQYFDDANGDWAVINSTNPFEILYLDYKQYKFISPEVVHKNYSLLEKFWKEKYSLMNTGGNRISFKNKYGDGTIDKSLQVLKRSFDKLGTKDGIELYYHEINSERLRKGKENLKDSIEHMLMDECADKAEIKLCIDRGARYDLSPDETIAIIKDEFDRANFKPYGVISGNTLLERVFSVEQWMTEARSIEEKKKEEDLAKTKVQILPGKFATTTNEIGIILFEDPVQAKKIIKEDLVKPVVAQKDVVLAMGIADISRTTKDVDAAYLKIIYKLNAGLPYRLTPDKLCYNLEELSAKIFDNTDSIKIGKEHFKRGFIEIWIEQKNKEAYQKFINIRDTSENFEIAFLKFLYTFNSSLPYRFAGKELVKTPKELAAQIDKNSLSWQAGKQEFYDGLITKRFVTKDRS